MTAKDHVTFAEMAEYVDSGRAPSKHFLNHLQECATCSELEREIRNLIGAMRISGHPEPSDDLIRSTWKRIQSLGSGEEAVVRELIGTVREKLREVWATLAPDALAPSLAVRGTTSASPRLLVYESEDYAISLSFTFSRECQAMDILGKVIPKTSTQIPPEGRVVLYEDDSEHEAELGEHGGFRYTQIRRGPIRLDIELGEYRIHLPRIEEIDEDPA